MTVPVGVPVPGDTTLTVAVNVTDWPYTDGLKDERSPVVVLPALTICDSCVAALPLKLPSPLYVASTVWLPTVANAFVKIACPEALTLTLVDEPPSMVKATVPVRVPAPGAIALTVAVKATGWPATEGFGEDASVVVVSDLLTVCVRTDEVLLVKLPSLL